MDLSDWLLALHLISAALLVGAIFWFIAVLVAARRATSPAEASAYFRTVRVAVPLVGAGSLLVLLFGVWLAFDKDGYHVWDPWVLAAIVLWAIASGAGQRSGVGMTEAATLANQEAGAGSETASPELLAAVRSPQALRLQLVSIGCVALILLDMIFKPGADTLRPDSVNVALLFHVLGALTLVGGLIVASGIALLGLKDEDGRRTRLSYRVLLLVAFPGYIVMRICAEWVYQQEHWDKVPDSAQPSWLGFGYLTADAGGLLLLIALILGAIGLRKMRGGGNSGLVKASGVIATLLVLVYVVALWAMGAKPS